MTTEATAAPPADLERTLLKAWSEYVEHFIQPDGRVIDHAGGGVTTSEGQAYAMMRAVWIDDRQTFDKAHQWMRHNLQGGDPSRLPAWRWGQRPDGSWDVLDPMPASDADQLVALALLLAARRWSAPELRHEAVTLLDQIWTQETLEIGSHRYMLPGPWAAHERPIRLNPSYLMPFAYREFADADPGHPWMHLVDSSYLILEASIVAYGLPPDWCYVDPDHGTLTAPPEGSSERLAFGYEALRVPWNLAADAQWNHEERAHALLVRIGHLMTLYRQTGSIPATIGAGGDPRHHDDYLGLYGALVPAWQLSEASAASALYDREVAAVRGQKGWGAEDDYYGQNWIWFGLALWSRRAPDGGMP